MDKQVTKKEKKTRVSYNVLARALAARMKLKKPQDDASAKVTEEEASEIEPENEDV